jgi:ribosomal protein S27AE
MATLTCGRCRRSDLQVFVSGLLTDPPGWSEVTVTGKPVINRRLCPACSSTVRKIVSAVI